MNLPHLFPLLFAKEIISLKDNKAEVLCQFPNLPTLPMILEAAAQASSAFEKNIVEGFLVSANDIEMFHKINKAEVVITVKKETQMQNMKMFSFEIQNAVQGKFVIYVR